MLLIISLMLRWIQQFRSDQNARLPRRSAKGVTARL